MKDELCDSRLAMQSLAVDISLAALLGDKVYSFGELLLHPIVGLLLYLPFSCTVSAACLR